MRMNIRVKMLGVAAVTAAMMFAAGPALATPVHSSWSGHNGGSITCAGGTIGSGTYDNITVTGACSVTAGAVVNVTGNITLTKGATLDAQSAPSTITVAHDVTALSGALLGLGCQGSTDAFHPCAGDYAGQQSTITVNGNITAWNAATVLLNGLTVRGSITALGGGSPIPWSIKHNTVGGSITVAGQTTNWIGVLFNQIGGNVTLLHIAITDTDPGAHGAFVVQNTIRHNLFCFGVTPTVTGGLFPGEPLNTVGGRAFGQCAALA